MAKPMIVTFPFLLFLLDFWPLKRPFTRGLIVEKIPFFALSGAVIVITLRAQHVALQTTNSYPLRIENALITVFIYLGQTLWPARLWTPYAYPDIVPAWQSTAAAIAIMGVCALALIWRKSRPWLAVGWFWFLGTLIPVIGVVQAGDQGHADRYMYVPMVGLAIVAAWAGAEAARHWPRIRVGIAVLAVALCVAMSVRTSLQTKYWKTTYELFGHAVDIDAQNYLAWHYLALTFSGDPSYNEAVIAYYKKATDIRPGYTRSHNNLGIALTHSGRYPEAIEEFETAFTLDPGYAEAHSNLGTALSHVGRKDDAVRELEISLRLDPDSYRAHTELGAILWNKGHTAEGIAHFEQAVRLEPDYTRAWYDLGWALLNQRGREAASIPDFRQALRIEPDNLEAHVGLATALLLTHGDKSEAIAHLKAAQQIHDDAGRQMLLDLLEQP
jgi:Tfp pilus assembly protein PilF